MTPTERLRFARAYFQLRSLLCLSEADADQRLQCLTSARQLYVLYEICLLPPGIDSTAPLDRARWRQARSLHIRRRLREAVWRRIEQSYQQAYGGGTPEDVEYWAHEDGYGGFVALWDHWQENLKQVICGLRPVPLGQAAGYDHLELWDSEQEK